MGISADISSAAGAALGIIGVVLITYLVALGLGVVMYILQSLGLYTIAKRRGIKNPWMAWVPVTNMWILGSISDQYRYVTQGKIRNRRKVLLGLMIAYLAVYVVFFCIYTGMFMNMIMQIPAMENMSEAQMLKAVLDPFLWMMLVALAMFALAVVLTVFQYLCLYDLYASCVPENKVLFLVLSILFNVTMPFFVFACRKKDLGMPPRKDEVQPVLPAQPEPWETTEE